MAGKRCNARGCPAIITNGNTKCPQHQREADAARGTTTQRGYGHTHQAERARWATILRARPIPCARCGAPIRPGEPFDLGHTDDRNGYIGPEHPECNRSAGGREGGRASIRS